MTYAQPYTPAVFEKHCKDLAQAFDVNLIIEPTLDERNSHSGIIFRKYWKQYFETYPWLVSVRPRIRIDGMNVFVSEINCDRRYAVALHELGHAIAPGGCVRPFLEDLEVHSREEANRRLMAFKEISLDEETIAWQWAKKMALTWTYGMQQAFTEGMTSHLLTPPKLF